MHASRVADQMVAGDVLMSDSTVISVKLRRRPLREQRDRFQTELVWAMAALALTAGAWQAGHGKPPEDLTRQIFPE